jgi:hypothetical protein
MRSLKKSVEAYQAANLYVPYNVTATGQTVIGVFVLFLLILTVRNRFRMG